MEIELEELKQLFDRLRQINSVELKDLKVTKRGKVVTFPPFVLERYKVLGLDNFYYLKQLADIQSNKEYNQ